jgi:VWFA-related protein
MMKRIAAAMLLVCSAALAQVSPVPAEQSPQLRTQSNIVLVPALVRNAKGELVYALNASDFRVTDDGVEQALTLDEDTGGDPLALVVAVETGGGGARRLADYGNLGSVIAALVDGVQHRIAVVSFDSTPSLQRAFTSDTDAAAVSLENLDPGDKGAAILDALNYSVGLLQSQPPNWRRAILIISETVDHSSHTTLNHALRSIGETNTAIYSLAFSSAKSDAAHYADRELPFSRDANGIQFENAHPNPPHGCMGKDPDPDATQKKANQAFDCAGQLLPPLALAKMAAIAAADGLQQNVPETVARVTGGEYFKFEDHNGLARDLLAVSNHLPNRYVLSFQPRAPHAGYHSVQLSLRTRNRLHVTARSGYWADSSEALHPNAAQPPPTQPPPLN